MSGAEHHAKTCQMLPQVAFSVEDPAFKLADLLALELHKFEDEVSEIVDRAQKEEKMEFGLKKLEDTWTKVSFQFTKHKDTDVSTVKMAEEDFEVGEELKGACQLHVCGAGGNSLCTCPLPVTSVQAQPLASAFWLA